MGQKRRLEGELGLHLSSSEGAGEWFGPVHLSGDQEARLDTAHVCVQETCRGTTHSAGEWPHFTGSLEDEKEEKDREEPTRWLQMLLLSFRAITRMPWVESFCIHEVLCQVG